MASGSKGPAVMLIRGQAQYRNAYIIAISNGHLFGAVDAVIGMASLLPKEAQYQIPEPPAELLASEVIDYPKKRLIQKWLMLEKTKVENAISTYVFNFYKKGGEASNL